MITLALALRGAVAVGVLIALVGGIPWLVHAGLAVALGLWAALLAPATQADSIIALAAHEAVIGATLGVLAALPLVAARTAGRLVDLAGRARGPYDAMFGVLAAAVFVGMDGHVAVIRAVATSYQTPPTTSVIEQLGRLIPTAVHLALPWLITAAVIELAAGVASRVGGRATMHAPYAAAAPAALVMMTAALVSTLAVAIARLIT